MQWLKAIVIAVLGALLAVTPAAGRDPKSDEQALLRLEDEWFYSRGGETRERIYARLRAHHRRRRDSDTARRTGIPGQAFPATARP